MRLTAVNHGYYMFNRRANTFAEEFRGGDMERECIEEVCSQDEMVEIFKAEDRSLRPVFKRHSSLF